MYLQIICNKFFKSLFVFCICLKIVPAADIDVLWVQSEQPQSETGGRAFLNLIHILLC